jgi:hypothetical protein
VGKVLLSLHVLAAIVFIGPVTVAVSVFPRYARATSDRSAEVVALLHRISRVYAVLGLSVPVLGIALAAHLGVLGDAWVVASLVLTIAAALVLAVVILPAQDRLMVPPAESGAVATRAATASRLSMASGLFSLLWAVVVVLMVVRPGSTTGV